MRSHVCVDWGGIDDSRARRVGDELLAAFKRFARSDGNAEVSVFTDRTPGHVWRVFMNKTADTEAAFRFRAVHSPAPCSLVCSAPSLNVAQSDQIAEVYEMLVYHITSIVREEQTLPCCQLRMPSCK